MNALKKLAYVVSGTVAALSVLSDAEQPLDATAPVGVTFTVLNRATVPEFDARRRYRQESDDPQPEKKAWKIELEATRMVDVVTVLFMVQPGGHSGWSTSRPCSLSASAPLLCTKGTIRPARRSFFRRKRDQSRLIPLPTTTC
jgi:hypothetical protein